MTRRVDGEMDAAAFADVGMRWPKPVAGMQRIAGGRVGQQAWDVRLWIAQALIALYAAMVANLLCGLPLGAVADIVLPLQFFLPLVFIGRYLVTCAAVDGHAEQSGPAGVLIGNLLSPFAATVVFALYAGFYDAGPIGQSLFFGGLVNHVAQGLRLIADLGAVLDIPQAAILTEAGVAAQGPFVLAALGLLVTMVNGARHRRA